MTPLLGVLAAAVLLAFARLMGYLVHQRTGNNPARAELRILTIGMAVILAVTFVVLLNAAIRLTQL